LTKSPAFTSALPGRRCTYSTNVVKQQAAAAASGSSAAASDEAAAASDDDTGDATFPSFALEAAAAAAGAAGHKYVSAEGSTLSIIAFHAKKLWTCGPDTVVSSRAATTSASATASTGVPSAQRRSIACRVCGAK